MDHVTGIDALLRDIDKHALNSKGVGDAVEAAADLGMWFSPLYRGRFAWTQTWASWARSNELPPEMQHDIGVDRVITTVDGYHWLVQTKGHDVGTARPQSTFVEWAAVSKLHALRGVKGLRCEKLIVITTGAGLSRHAKAANAAAGLGVIVHNRTWLSEIREMPETVDALKVAYGAMMKKLADNPPAGILPVL